VKIFGIRVKTLANLFGIVWLGSLVAFFGLGYAVLQPENMLSADLLRILSTVIISTGIFSFALAVVLYFLHFVNSNNKQVKKKIGKKKNNDFANVEHRVLVSSVVGLSIIGILLLVALFAKSTSIISGSSIEQATTSQPQFIDCVIRGKLERVASEVCKDLGSAPTPTTTGQNSNVNPDPIISCESSHPKCQGSTLKLPRSQCSNIYCCGIDNNWSLYPSEEKCKEAGANTGQQAQAEQNSNSTGKVPVFLSYWGYSVNCPSQNVGAVMAINSIMESKKDEWTKNVQNCVDSENSVDPCRNNCTAIEHSTLSSCQASTQDSQKYIACSNQASSDWLNCAGACPNNTTSCINVNSEQQSLNDQITNLCK